MFDDVFWIDPSISLEEERDELTGKELVTFHFTVPRDNAFRLFDEMLSERFREHVIEGLTAMLMEGI